MLSFKPTKQTSKNVADTTFKGVSPPDDSISSNLEITTKNEKGFNCNVLALDFLYTGVVFVFVSQTFDWVWVI